ncbi:leucine-rich repeat domain-containing protein [Streptomyces sp. NBC_00287]|uniref:caspase, EACC1-associated type n=1 Tax=Streptomyces sp. NBC_00287 TaxID=2975702 RepID=UPI002E2B5679|nr:caspase family protein [Streptomyces sp. NBC_00287]
MTSTAPDLPFRQGSRAILIGVSDYEDTAAFPPIPAAMNSLARMREMLTDPALCGWPPDQVTVMPNPRNAGKVATELRKLLQDVPPSGVALLYYVGHGRLTVEGRLCLTVADSVDEAPEYTGISYTWVAQALRRGACAARVKTTILDCCYSGHADETLAADSSGGLADLTHIDGVYTLTATARNQTAHVPPLAEQDTATTSFTGQLLDLVRTGIPSGPAHLAFVDLYPLLQQRLASRGLPRPGQRGTGTADRYPFTKNAALSLADPVPPPSTARAGGAPTPNSSPIKPTMSIAEAIRFADHEILEHSGKRNGGLELVERRAVHRIKAAQRNGSRVLDLGHLVLERLPRSLYDLTDLKVLNLGGNWLTSFPPDLLRLAELTELSLDYNPLTRLPDSIGQLTHLTYLSICGFRLEHVPDGLGGLTHLTHLDLGGQTPRSLPKSIGQLTNLTYLDLGGHLDSRWPRPKAQVNSLTQGRSLMTALMKRTPGRFVDFVGVALTSATRGLTYLPKEIGRLANLTHLNLCQNKLTTLPPQIGELASLTHLDLRENGLTKLPKEIGQLTNLVHLDLRGNNLARLPRAIDQLPSLRVLDVSGNPLVR